MLKFPLKLLRHTSILFLIILINACSVETQEEVVETHANGQAKTMVTYQINGEEKIKVASTRYYSDGVIEVSGEFDADEKRIGKWFYNYPSGSIWSECGYKAGLRDGYSAVYYKNGQKRYEGNYKDDKTIGTWKFYSEEGELLRTVEY